MMEETNDTSPPRYAKASLFTRIKRSITEFTSKFNFSTDNINRIKFTPGEFSFDENTLNIILIYDNDNELDFGAVSYVSLNAIYLFIYYLSGIITLPLLLIEYLIMPLPTIVQDGIHLMSTSIRLLVTLLIWSSVNIFTQALSIIPKLIIFAIAKTFNLVMFILHSTVQLIQLPFILISEILKSANGHSISPISWIIIFPLVYLGTLILFYLATLKILISNFLVQLFTSSNAFQLGEKLFILEFDNSIIPSFIDKQYYDDPTQTSIYSDLYHFIIDIITTPFKLLWYPLTNLFSGSSLSESGHETKQYNKNQFVDSKSINREVGAKYGSDDNEYNFNPTGVNVSSFYNK